MEVRIKKLCKNAVIPSYAHISDAGMDLTATSMKIDEDGNVVYGTGIAIEIPTGYVGLVFPRSSNSKKTLWLTNSVGVIDSGYRGEITFKFRPSIAIVPNFWAKIKLRLSGLKAANVVQYASPKIYKIGDRIGQIIILPYPSIEFIESDFLYPSDRGECGYGSTGE